MADTAVRDMIDSYLDDLHSTFQTVSPMTGFDTKLPPGRLGFSVTADRYNMEKYETERTKAFPMGAPFYQEVGDTAFVTFDEFEVAPDVDYY